MKVLSFRDLRSKGIPFTRQHIHKLVKRGEFPRPFKIGGKTNAWDEPEVDQYLKDRLARREMKTAESRVSNVPPPTDRIKESGLTGEAA